MSRGTKLAFVLIGLSLLGRLALAAVSIGTNDAMTFAEFGKQMGRVGLIDAYRADVYLNHPPLVCLWAGAAMRMVNPPEVPLWVALPANTTWAFSFIFKLPFIAADALACGVLYLRWRETLGRARAAAVAAAFAWAPASFLVAAYHANTDPLYTALCLLAVWLMESRRSFFWAGLALGAAINVKIIPGLMVAPLLLTCRSRAQARLFLAGLALAAVPFLPPMFSDFPTFCRNVLSYAGFPDAWGFNLFLMNAQRVPPLSGVAGRLINGYHSFGRVILLSAVVGWAILARLRPRWDRYEIAAVTAAIFLVFSPSFGVQYMVLPGLMLFAVRPRLAIVYAIATGTFLLKIYLQAMNTHHVPLVSLLVDHLGAFDSGLAFVAWAVLVWFLWSTVRRAATEASDVAVESGGTTPRPAPAAAPPPRPHGRGIRQPLRGATELGTPPRARVPVIPATTRPDR